MSTKFGKPRLSKNILEMKFMQRTKKKVDKEIEDSQGRAMYSNEISSRMVESNSNFIIEPSFLHCENLIDGRLSFRGMNPEIEKLLELEKAENQANAKHEQPREVSNEEMAKVYYSNRAPTATNAMKKKFSTKSNKRGMDYQISVEGKKKKFKYMQPKSDTDDEN